MPIHHDLQTAIFQITHSAIQIGIPEHCIHPSHVRNTIFLLTIEKAAQEYMMTVPGVPFKTPICYLSEHTQRLLWHFHSGHPNSDRLIKLQKISKGIPRLKYPQAIEKCSSCIVAKMHKMAPGGPENQDPTAPGQMMSMDFGFMF